jgi:hypothetical protein
VTDKIKNAALTAFRLALRPLVRVLLRNGITWKEAAEVCKETYVEVARREYGVHGRPTNASRIAILTGLSRREVKRVSDTLKEGEPVAIEKMNRATRVLGGWHTDDEFTGTDGKPLELSLTDGDISFSTLSQRYAPDIPPITMLKELKRVGAVAEQSADRFRAIMRYYIPDFQDPDAVLRAGSVLEDLGNTVAFNLELEKGGAQTSRFEGRATNANVRASSVKKFRAFIESEAQAFLERIDEWLAQHEKSADRSRPERRVRLGLGVYQIQDDQRNRKEK